MNKRGRVFIILAISLIFILSTTIVFAQSSSTQEQDNLDKAYQCIRDKVNDDCSNLNSEEQASVLLSLGDYKSCRSEFLKNSKDDECWPKASCKLKDTAIALLALENSGASDSQVNKVKNWLLNQTKSVSELTWYLELETNDVSSCTISYGQTTSISIGSDKKINSISGGNCFSISENGYWAKISSSCLDKEFTISCNKDFSSTLLYKSQASDTIHVSQNIQSSVSGGEIREKIIYKCFKEGTVCNYEGSLWASIALAKKNVDTSVYLPYLDSFSEDNEKFFPEAFLFILTGSEEYLQSILQDNFKGNFWLISTYGKFYDTATAFLSLQDQSLDSVEQSKSYLLDGKTQNTQGCWNTVKDTGLLLYSGWSSTSTVERPECSSDSDCSLDKKCLGGLCRSGSDETKDCTLFSNFCEQRLDCLSASGSVLEDYSGCSGIQVCCSVEVQKQSCAEQSGSLCDRNEECPSSGRILDSSDAYICCSSECTEKIINQEPACISSGYQCQSSCLDNQEENSLSCDQTGIVCCQEKTTEKKSLWWVWVLLILIVLVILGIIFRNRLRVMLFKRKSGFGKGPAPKETRPPFFPPAHPSHANQRPANTQRPFFPRPAQRPAPSRQQSAKDKEFEETLKKLKSISN